MSKAIELSTTRRRAMLGAAAIFAAGAAVVPAEAYGATSIAHPDAALLSLGADLRTAAARETDAWAAAEGQHDDTPDKRHAEALNDAASAIVERIIASRATTLDGLLVKARAFTWCRCGDPLTADDFELSRGDVTTDMRVLISLMADLSAIGGAA